MRCQRLAVSGQLRLVAAIVGDAGGDVVAIGDTRAARDLTP